MAGTFVEGWESGISDWVLESGAASDVAPSTDEAFACTHSLKIDLDAIGDGADSLRYQISLPGSGLQNVEYWLSCAVFIPVGFTASLANGDMALLPGFAFNDAGIFSSFWAVLIKTGGQLFAQFTVTATNSPAITEGTWHFFELSAEVDSTTEDVTSSMYWNGTLVDTDTFTSGLGDGTTIDGLYVGSMGLTGAEPYYIDTLEWDQTGQIGQVQTGDETCAVSGQSFQRSPQWRFIVTTLNPQVITQLDRLASQRRVTYLLNGPAVMEAVVPSDNPRVNILLSGDPYVEEGIRCVFGFRREGGTPPWKIRFAGILLQLEDTGESEDADTHIAAYDPWRYLYARPVRNGTGGLPGVNGLSFGATTGDVIAGTLLLNTINEDGAAFIDAGLLFGGTAFYAGTLETTAALDINFQQGTSVGQAWQQLVETNTLDIVLDPIWDPVNRPGYLCELNIYDQAGSTRDASVFTWDKTARSLVSLQRAIDGTRRANRVQYFQDQGGDPVTLQSDATSIARYGEYWDQQFFPNQTVDAAVESLAALVLELRKNGKYTVTFSPAPERMPLLFTEFFLGDRVPVHASSKFRDKLSGYQRIYGIPIDIDDNGVERIREMITVIEG